VVDRTLAIVEGEAQNRLLLPIPVQCPLVIINLFGDNK
jgi:hypothetical protein